MTYTAWDYRKLAEYHEQLGNAIIAKHYLAFADTLEENARLRAAIEGRQAMSYTAEQLRAKARNLRELGRQLAADDCEAHADALEENARLRAEANDDDALRERMADILTRTAAALKGEPEPLTLHDWSGLPEIAERAVSELAKLRQKLMRCEHAEAADILHPPQEETK